MVYKQRKRKTTTSLKDRSFRKGRGYKEFLEYIASNKSVYVVEMDTVEGAKGTSPCFLTMFFRNCSLMLMFLLEEQTQKEVTYYPKQRHIGKRINPSHSQRKTVSENKK